MKKRNIKFPLIMENEVEVRTIEELREHFSLENVLGYFFNGKLKTWLNHRYYEEEAIQIEELEGKEKSNALKEKLCEILGVEYEDSNELDIDVIELRKERIAKLSLYTDEKSIIEKIDIVAFDQEELSDLLDNNQNEIYLCSGEFAVPIARKDVTYYGIYNPIVKITSKNDVNFDSNNILFNEVTITSQNTISVKASQSKGIKFAGNIISNNQTDDSEKKVDITCWDKININPYAEYKDWIYYYDDVEGSFYKVGKFDNEKVKISDETIKDFKIEDDIIYYRNEEQLYQVDMNGKNKTYITGDVSEFDVDKENIYFTAKGEWIRRSPFGDVDKMTSTKPYIFKNRDYFGSHQVPYGDYEGGVTNIKASNGWLYYIYIYDYKLYRIKSNLTAKQLLVGDSYINDYYIKGDWVYFADKRGECIKKVKLNGIGETIVCKGTAISLKVSDNYIFYMSEDYSINRCNLDGSNRVKLCEDCSRVNDIGGGNTCTEYSRYEILGDWLYYQNGKEDFMVYKISINGGQSVMVE